jgi:hypothetical protein
MPQKNGGDPTREVARHTITRQSSGTDQDNARQRREDLSAQLHRRRAAALRLPPLECCGCRDPYTCRCHEPVDKTERRWTR